MRRMLEITIPIEEDILISLKESEAEFKKDIRFWVGLILYKKGKLSLGKAAEFSGYNEISFINRLSLEGEAIFDYTDGEISEIINDSKKLSSIK